MAEQVWRNVLKAMQNSQREDFKRCLEKCAKMNAFLESSEIWQLAYDKYRWGESHYLDLLLKYPGNSSLIVSSEWLIERLSDGQSQGIIDKILRDGLKIFACYDPGVLEAAIKGGYVRVVEGYLGQNDVNDLKIKCTLGNIIKEGRENAFIDSVCHIILEQQIKTFELLDGLLACWFKYDSTVSKRIIKALLNKTNLEILDGFFKVKALESLGCVSTLKGALEALKSPDENATS